MPILNRLHSEHGQIRWLFVYTMEAHAVDEWPISSSRYNPSGEVVSISQHQSLADRIAAAEAFRETFEPPFPLVVDGLEDSFEQVFCTWPFRFYIIRAGMVTFQSQPVDCTHHLEPFLRALEAS